MQQRKTMPWETQIMPREKPQAPARTSVRTVLPTRTIKNVFVKNACACCKAKEVGFITAKNTISILVFKVVKTSEILRTQHFIIVTFAEG